MPEHSYTLRCLALVALVLGGAQACVPTIPYTSGASVPQGRVKAIQPGITTKYELLESFGMPMAIAKQGESVAIPRGRQHTAGGSPGSPSTSPGFNYASAETFFEPFSQRGLGPQHRVYYYAHTVSTKRVLLIITYAREWAQARSDELWVLVNEEKGVVEDLLYRPAP